MKALSLLQPWASLVVMGIKKIETRNWSAAYRGPLLIHAGKSRAGALFMTEAAIQKHISNFDALPFGAIIGRVELVDILPADSPHLTPPKMQAEALEERAFGDYTAQRFAWIFEGAVLFGKPVPARGMLQLWEYPGVITG